MRDKTPAEDAFEKAGLSIERFAEDFRIGVPRAKAILACRTRMNLDCAEEVTRYVNRLAGDGAFRNEFLLQIHREGRASGGKRREERKAGPRANAVRP